MTDITITIDDLESYRGLKAELEALKQEHEENYLSYSGINYEYTGEAKGNAVSNPTEKAALRALRLEQWIIERTEECAERLDRIYAWLDTVQIAEIRAIVHHHYILGETWEETCLHVYGYRSYQACRKRCLRFFGKEK